MSPVEPGEKVSDLLPVPEQWEVSNVKSAAPLQNPPPPVHPAIPIIPHEAESLPVQGEMALTPPVTESVADAAEPPNGDVQVAVPAVAPES